MCKVVVTEEINALANKIKEAISVDPPASAFSMGIVLSRVMTPEDMDLMERMENQYGYHECNQWLVEIMASTGHFDLHEDGQVSRSRN